MVVTFETHPLCFLIPLSDLHQFTIVIVPHRVVRGRFHRRCIELLSNRIVLHNCMVDAKVGEGCSIERVKFYSGLIERCI